MKNLQVCTKMSVVSSHAELVPKELEEVLEWLPESFDSMLIVSSKGKGKAD